MRLIIKAKKMPVGTVSHGRKKVAEGKWVPVRRKRKKKPVEKGKEPWRSKPVKSKVFPNVAKASFNQNPEMMGHYSARKFVWETEQKLGKYMSDPKKKALVQATLRTEADGWNYFAVHVSGKDVNLIAHTLRYLDRQRPIELLEYESKRSGMLKTDLGRLLEHAAYTHNRKEFIKYQSSGWTWMGLTQKEAEERAEKYGAKLKDDYHDSVLKIWGKPKK